MLTSRCHLAKHCQLLGLGFREAVVGMAAAAAANRTRLPFAGQSGVGVSTTPSAPHMGPVVGGGGLEMGIGDEWRMAGLGRLRVVAAPHLSLPSITMSDALVLLTVAASGGGRSYSLLLYELLNPLPRSAGPGRPPPVNQEKKPMPWSKTLQLKPESARQAHGGSKSPRMSSPPARRRPSMWAACCYRRYAGWFQ
jgi:hypothetical protein